MGKGEREKRERLREEREAAEHADERSGRNRLIVGYSIAGVAILAIAVVIVVIATGSSASGGDAHINLNESIGSTNGIEPDDREGTPPPPLKVSKLAVAAKKAGCVLKLKLKDEGHEHIPASSPTPKYGTNPPTSGSHVEPPFQQADGAYSEMPKEIDFVHTLEHGRMEIQYSPRLPEKDQLALKGLYDTMYGATLLFPNTKMPYRVAATTWTNLIGCSDYRGAITLDAIRDFGKETWGRYGGEPVRGFTFTGPTPAAPEIPSP